MEYWLDVVNRILMFGMLAISLNLLVGYAGYLSLGHAAFFGIGAYAAGLVAIHLGWPFVAAALVAILVAGLSGAVVGFPALRISGEYVVLLTLAFLGVVSQLEIAWISLTGGSTGLFPIPRPTLLGWTPESPGDYLILNGAATTLFLAIALRAAGSPWGRVLRAMREDSRATRALGKPTLRFAVTVFAVSSAMAGFVGALWAHYFSFITPASFNLDQTIFIAAIVVLGGLGNLVGSLLGAGALILLAELLTKVDVGADDAALIQKILYGVALVVLMRYRPGGILGEHTRLLRRRRPLDEGSVGILAAAPARAPTGATARTILRGEGVTKHFGGITALQRADITLDAGTITSLVGPNGAGKTTLFNCLTGDLVPDDGRVELDGREITGMPPNKTVQLGMARSFQDVRIFLRMSVLDNVLVAIQDQPGESLWRTFLRPSSVRRAEQANVAAAAAHLQAVGLLDQAHTIAGDLSYGEQKLLALARLMATESDVILLDEPSAGIDPQWVERMLELIVAMRDAGKTVCIVEHNLDVVRRLPGDACFLESGRLVARGSIDDLMRQERLVASYFGH